MDLIPKQEMYIKTEPNDESFNINNPSLVEIKDENLPINSKVEFEEKEIKIEPTDIKTMTIIEEKIDIDEEFITETAVVVEAPDTNNTHTSSVYKCDICDYTSTGQAKLQWHSCIHSNETVFSCNECEYKTTKETYFHRHTIVHTKNNLFKCTFCEYSASRWYHYNRHLLTHTKEKPFKCDVCDYKSSQKNHMQRHMSIHTGEKPFKCTQCDYKSAYKHSMIKHKKIHLTNKYFKCDKCDFRTSVKKNFQMHIHTKTKDRPFKCNICDYKATEKQYLQQHMITHANKKPFKCNKCDYETAYKRNIKMHQQNHLTGKYFKCAKCDYKTAVKLNFDMHIHNVKEVETVIAPPTNKNVKKCVQKKKKACSVAKKFFECSQCDYKTKVKRLFEWHLPTHIIKKEKKEEIKPRLPPLKNVIKQNDGYNNKYFKCSKCKYRTTVERNFQMHVHSPKEENPASILPKQVTSTITPDNHDTANTTPSATVTAPGVNLNSGFVYVVSPLQTMNQNYYFQM